jgi:hypothetical protein
MLWEGHGGKLRVETSNNPRVKRFLDAVPYIMASGVIRPSETHIMAANLNTNTPGKKRKGACMREMRQAYTLSTEKHHLGDLGVDGRIILRWNLAK